MTRPGRTGRRQSLGLDRAGRVVLRELCSVMKTAIATRLCLLGVLISIRMDAGELTRNLFTQVVGEVSIVSAETKQTRKAQVNTSVHAPDLIRTGPNSRAELKAPDGTLTRIGANTIFAFETRGRGVNLQQGNILFHSPRGKGGGVIRTSGSSAAVLGTTLVVSTSPQGGFKTILLEGRGRVTSPSGDIRRLDAGQLVFSLPGSALSQALNVDLGRMVGASALMMGYATDLPSLAKVSEAVEKQQAAKASGRLEDTGLIAGNSATEDTVTALDPAMFSAALREKKSSIEKAWDRDVDLDDSRLPERQLFSRDDSRYPRNSLWRDVVTDVVLGDEVDVKARDIVIPSATGDSASGERTFGIVAKKLEIKGDTDIHAPVRPAGQGQDPDLVVGGRSLEIADNARVTYTGNGNLAVGSEGSFKTRNVGLASTDGDLNVISQTGSVEMDGGWASAGGRGGVEVRSGKKDVDLKGVTLTGQTLTVKADNDARLNNVNFQLRNDSGYTGPRSIAIEAHTVVLSDVDLPTTHPIHLRSKEGKLAPNPNTGAAKLNGYVNFHLGVTSGGRGAQYAVDGFVDNDGTVHRGGNIIVSSLPNP